jgi:uncharacterized protein involved in exopolysaccharide biosynthesis
MSAEEGKAAVLRALRPPEAEPARGDVLDLYRTFRDGLPFILLLPLLAGLLCSGYLFLIRPPDYVSEAVLLPEESRPGGRSVMEDMLAEFPLRLEMKSPDESDEIMAFLESRRLKKRLINEHDLLPVLYPERLDPDTGTWAQGETPPDVVLALQEGRIDERYSAEYDESRGLIAISWKDESPERAAEMLAAVIDELGSYLSLDYVSEATRNRVFLEARLAEAREELEAWEVRLPGPEMPASRIQREIEAAATVYVELRRRLALAKIAEAERIPAFEVLDPPYVPVKPEITPKLIVIAVVGLAAFFLALALVFARSFVLEAREDSRRRKRLSEK